MPEIASTLSRPLSLASVPWQHLSLGSHRLSKGVNDNPDKTALRIRAILLESGWQSMACARDCIKAKRTFTWSADNARRRKYGPTNRVVENV
jgi:hypothetical protein